MRRHQALGFEEGLVCEAIDVKLSTDGVQLAAFEPRPWAGDCDFVSVRSCLFQDVVPLKVCVDGNVFQDSCCGEGSERWLARPPALISTPLLQLTRTQQKSAMWQIRAL